MNETVLAKSYSPGDSEPLISQKWDESGVFHAEPSDTSEGGKPPYCILIPPPNVTAALHLGHALNNTLQDVLIRHHRMRGFNTLWMPGTDHAGIATQTVVEKRLLAQGTSRRELGRERFIETVQAWKDEYEATITEQLKVMGCSCDWQRQRFTMDDICAKAVREAFFRLFKDGLIYRGKRLVNWDPVSQTALADDEVEMEEVQGHMWYLQYPLEDGSGHVTVATTRPETMLGDTAVAMNPKDARAKDLAAKQVRLPIVGRVIPIVEDDYVVLPRDMGGDPADPKSEIATGFLKVTPAHDQNDWDIGQRHDLPLINVMAPDATISTEHGWDDCCEEAQQFVGLSREEARDRIVEWFKTNDLLEKVKDYSHSVGHSYRSHVPIEPYLSDQWYVRVTDDRLVGEAQRAQVDEQYEGERPARDGNPAAGDSELTFFPARYSKTFQAWHDNLRDWCISRQLWWGHQIPVWSRFWTDHDLLTRRPHASPPHSGETPDPPDSVVADRWDGVQSHQFASQCERGVEGYWIRVCVAPGNGYVEEILQDANYVQDPDVLDTWFSSGLWPLSTMGWPDPKMLQQTESGANGMGSAGVPPAVHSGHPSANADGTSAFPALLDTFNPSSVLCTAREIITLWVSRMVMFNRYFMDDHRLPYKHVYIHPMIQDGHGQKMSKSLGNGVDPRDIIHTHGADALRMVMCQIATSTQDVRLPVDTVCPHCDEPFHPKEITTHAGHRVAAPEQSCPKCKKGMVTVFGVATGAITPTADQPLARNTSAKFDFGRNFCNKLWNATRFALSNLAATTAEPSPAAPLPGGEGSQPSLADKWIIARLHRTLHKVDDAMAEYQFNIYSEAMYDLAKRDFCDWYLEAIKPTLCNSPAQQQVLRTVLNAILRMLHPICPFVTETLWPHVRATGAAGIEGIRLDDAELLAAAAWPDIKCSVEDKDAAATFERAQRLIEAIRTLRGDHGLPDRDKITLLATPAVQSLIEQTSPVVETLAGLKQVTGIHGSDEARDDGATPLPFEGGEQLIIGLARQIDPAEQIKALRTDIENLGKRVAGHTGRLANPGYVDKAPPHLVEQTRGELEQMQAELADKEAKLGDLGAIA